mmetsp:Transcript_34690/g.25837  ORF Transcript_34690/g.25837 Transcript_34690/m.25837 type:complete len:175 (-) Transcript_34690:31-555(-)
MNLLCFLADSTFFIMNIYFFYLFFNDVGTEKQEAGLKLYFTLWFIFTVLEVLIPIVFLYRYSSKDHINSKLVKWGLLGSCLVQGYYLYPVCFSCYKFYSEFTTDHQFMELWVNLFKGFCILAYGITLKVQGNFSDDADKIGYVIAYFSISLGGLLLFWNIMCIPCVSYCVEKNK